METQINCSDNENNCEIDQENEEEEDDEEDEDDENEEEDDDEEEEQDEERENTDVFDDDDEEDEDEDDEDEDDEEDDEEEEVEDDDITTGDEVDEDIDRVLNSKYKNNNLKLVSSSSSSSSYSSSSSSSSSSRSNLSLSNKKNQKLAIIENLNTNNNNNNNNNDKGGVSFPDSLTWNGNYFLIYLTLQTFLIIFFKKKDEQSKHIESKIKPDQIESSLSSSSSSITTLKHNKDDDYLNEEKLNLNKICFNGQTFLWDLLLSDSLNEENTLNEKQQQVDTTNNNNIEMSSTSSISSSISSISSNSSSNNKLKSTSITQHQKIIKEAEKQLQILLCLPSTDKRIRLKFIENCLLNLKSNKACVFSLRLLTKLFSSFQQYSTATTNNNNTNQFKTSISDLNLNKSNLTTISPMQEQLLFNSKLLTNTNNTNTIPANITEVHRIVALTEYNYAMISLFFEGLKTYTSEQLQRITTYSEDEHDEKQKFIQNPIRLNIQSRLQFLSFIFSSLGSPRDFELPSEYVEILWDSLIQFNDFTAANCSIKDDLFNWFSSQAKNKDQHAINIDTFKFIFINKMPYLDPNHFSQTALHLYQELFKIYKYSFNTTIVAVESSNNNNNNNTKQIETSAIDYIWKLAFKSSNKDVSLAAIQFLNSHYIQTDNISSVDNENQFIDRCMCYLMNESYSNLIQQQQQNEENKVKANLAIIERGLLLIKNHLDSFQRRHSYQLRVWQFKSSLSNESNELNKFTSHLKLLKQIRSNTDSFRILTILNEISSINNSVKSLSNNLLASNNNNNSNLINLICQINPTQLKFINQSQFKFSLRISLNETVGDLRAILREILIRTIKSNKIVLSNQETDNNNHNHNNNNNNESINSYSFVNNQLIGIILFYLFIY
jgi:hypothetical protein